MTCYWISRVFLIISHLYFYWWPRLLSDSGVELRNSLSGPMAMQKSENLSS